GRVERLDPPGLIDGDDGIDRGVEDGPQASLPPARTVVHPCVSAERGHGVPRHKHGESAAGPFDANCTGTITNTTGKCHPDDVPPMAARNWSRAALVPSTKQPSVRPIVGDRSM